MKNGHRYLFNVAGFAASVLLLASGCGGGKGAAANTPAAGSAVPKVAKKENPSAPAKIARSVFTIDQNSRDPFNPQNKRTAAASANAASQPLAVDIAAVLSDGFQGVGGSPEERIAMINNVLLEQGKAASIPVRAGAQSRTLQVRCREIARDHVVLDVEGYGSVVVKHKQSLRAGL